MTIKNLKHYDVIVIGAGHAGIEASCASARMNANTLLITKSSENIGEMSCNPAIGGVAKGTIVREIDALDGIMGKAIDMAGIHFRILNSSKGPAVHSPRAQADRKLYKIAVNKLINNYPSLSTTFGEVSDIIIENNKVCGVIINDNIKIYSHAVVLTTGTFLNGMIHIGDKKIPAGRINEQPSIGISHRLSQHNFRLGRLKTGTPARIYKNSIKFDELEKQSGDEIPIPFSYLNKEITTEQTDCYITYTNPQTHKIINDNLKLSAMYGGNITGVGPRYCPSIEDKVSRFFDKTRHQVFLEPEGLESDLIYPNGLSTSLPEKIQEQFLRSIAGLQNCKISQFGYAIEYDYVDPTELLPTLQTKRISGLFFAGQINGTTGYEEAGGQGIIAGINAGICSKNSHEEFILNRSQSYIGVMIDDLTSLGTAEPYRMLTSRAEYRLNLRADNADLRLTEIGVKIGVVGNERKEIYFQRKNKIDQAVLQLKSLKISPKKLAEFNIAIKQDGVVRDAYNLLSFPEIKFCDLEKIWPEILLSNNSQFDHETKKQIAIDAIYSAYLDRQERDIELFNKEENMKIPNDLDYYKIQSLSNEVREKLTKFRPATIGQATRIQGITPASLMAIMIFVKNNFYKQNAHEGKSPEINHQQKIYIKNNF